jgi:hypothetical protein
MTTYTPVSCFVSLPPSLSKQLLRKSILQMGKPMLEAHDNPPFERPSIEQARTCKHMPTVFPDTQNGNQAHPDHLHSTLYSYNSVYLKAY